MIRIDHVTFSYGEENENAGGVHDINLTVEDGQCVVLCGESGCGKTTITRLINGLIPHYYEGKMNGEVWVNGAKVSEQPLYDTAKTVGSVFQNPRSQFFNVDTTSEITFGCENLGQPEQSIRERLDKTIRDFRLEKLMGRNIFHLSGGEKQKIACAGVSIMEPDVLVMDEPSSNLDASSILDLRAILAFWKSQGKTIIVSEHPYIRDRFKELEGINGFRLDALSLQIKSCFIKMEGLSDNKSDIFDQLVNWVMAKTCSTSREACEAVVSFFVQNCEVFHEITE